MPFDITDDLAYEIYALMILQQPFPNGKQIVKQTIDGKFLDFNYFEKRECPDWQSEELSLGLEVTIAMNEREIIDSKTFSKAVKGAKNIDEVKSNLTELDKKSVFSGEVTRANIFYMMGHDQPDNLSRLEKAIVKKIKSSKAYNKFLDNWLFIFFVGYLEKEKVPEVIKNITGHESFSSYIINPLGNSDGIWHIESPYEEVITRHYASKSNEMIVDEVEKVRGML